MDIPKLAFALLLVCACQDAKGESMHKKCTVYDEGETVRTLPIENGKGRHCEPEWGPFIRPEPGKTPSPPVKKTYCLDYDCPKLDCEGDNVVKKEGKCDKCKGDCEWLGKIVRNGTSGTCEDGCNTCGCNNGEVGLTTLKRCYPSLNMC